MTDTPDRAGLPQPVPPVKADGGASLPSLPPSSGDLQAIKDRVARADTPEEAARWLRVHGEMLRQIDYAAQREHERNTERDDRRHGRIMATVRLAFSPLVIVLGGMLTYAGYADAGSLTLGSGLFILAPTFVADFLKLGKRDNE